MEKFWERNCTFRPRSICCRIWIHLLYCVDMTLVLYYYDWRGSEFEHWLHTPNGPWSEAGTEPIKGLVEGIPHVCCRFESLSPRAKREGRENISFSTFSFVSILCYVVYCVGVRSRPPFYHYSVVYYTPTQNQEGRAKLNKFRATLERLSLSSPPPEEKNRPSFS